jgi:hypothetical protein
MAASPTSKSRGSIVLATRLPAALGFPGAGRGSRLADKRLRDFPDAARQGAGYQLDNEQTRKLRQCSGCRR